MKNKLWKFIVCGVLLLPLFSCDKEKVFKDYLTYYEEVNLKDINSVGIKFFFSLTIYSLLSNVDIVGT